MVWLRRFGSLKVSVGLLALTFVVVLGGTVAQAVWGASAVQTTLFARPFFEVGGFWWPGLPLVLALLGLNLLAGAVTHLERTWRAIGLWGLHLTLAVFCWATLGFSLSQVELVVGVVPGGSTNVAFGRSEAGAPVRLPFTLTLDAFQVETYPGSSQASDYHSLVTVTTDAPRHHEIRMNQPLRVAGWTVYQSSLQVVDGVTAPVYKLTSSPWATFPYGITVLLVGFLVFHGTLGRSRRGRS